MADRGSRRSETPGRSPSVRSAGVCHQAEETIEEMKKRLEKIQHEMNRAALHGVDVDPYLLEEQQNIFFKMKAEREAQKQQQQQQKLEEAQSRRAVSAPAPARESSRYRQDLEAGVHPRAARKAEKDRKRAEEHHKRLAAEGKPTPQKHRGGREKSEKKRKMLQREEDRLTMEEEEALIESQMSEPNETPEVKEQIAQALREAYLKRFGSEPGSARKPDQYRLEQEEESDSSLDELEEKFSQDLAITSTVEAELKRDERERKDLERRKSGRNRVDSEEHARQLRDAKECERENRRAYEREKKEREREELERQQRERREPERKKKEIDPKKVDERSRPAPRSSAAPAQPSETPHWINAADGSLKPFKEIHKLSQRFNEGKNDIYVSCLRCHKTIKGTEPYSLWAHVESKRCFPETAIKGWRQQAKEKEG